MTGMRMLRIFLFLLFSFPAFAETLPIVPDQTLTPGVIASTDAEEVCATGADGTYSAQHRHTSVAMKKAVYKNYNINKKGRDFEVDHRVPLALGGADDIKNLWPQEGWKHPSFHDKDKLESYLWREVCKNQTMGLEEAQSLLLGDWTKAYEQVFNQPP